MRHTSTDNVNTKPVKKNREKLILYRADDKKRDFHPLLNRKVRDNVKMESDLPMVLAIKTRSAVSKKFKVKLKNSSKFENITGQEEVLFQWLKDMGHDVCPVVDSKEITPDKALYSFDGKVCSFGYLLIIANQKRKEMEQLPFFVSWLFD